MIRINLLPFRAARTKENVRRQVTTFFLVFIVVLLLMLMISAKLGFMRSNIQNQVKSAQAELGKYTQKAKEVDDLKKENDLIQKKINIINDLQKVRKEPISLLSVLTDILVEDRMWLTSYEIKDKDVSIKGLALDEITVADFTKRLQGTSLYGEIVLKNLKQNVIDNIKTKSFEITGTITKPNEKKPDPKTNKALK